MKKLLGFDIGGTKCAVVCGDENGNVFKKIRFDTTDFESTLKNLIDAGKALFQDDIVSLSVAYNGYCEEYGAV